MVETFSVIINEYIAKAVVSSSVCLAEHGWAVAELCLIRRGHLQYLPQCMAASVTSHCYGMLDAHPMLCIQGPECDRRRDVGGGTRVRNTYTMRCI